ncbi:MAG: right-handed parallel beta-helix repeat-containing protein [Saprospiraceae bacterium]|nr:right-handed parallel beta-helix repeat-containing protein [Saprospiraceae bacterium]
MNTFFSTALLLLLAAQAPANTWYVATNGNDNNAGTLASPFKTLPAAIDAANPGDEILLRGGNYVSQEIRIGKNNLHIKSYPGEWAVISAPTNVEDVSACIWYNDPETSGGTLERLEIVGGYYYAVKFETNWDWDNSVPFNQRRGVSNVSIRNCNIHHSGRDAVKLTPACANISILDCEIHHTGTGPGALLDFNAEGIDNVNAPGLTVRGCHFHDIATTGIYVKGGGRDCVIEANRIENCGEGGIYLGFYTDAEWFDTDFNPQYFENIDGLVLNNIVLNTQHAGIGLWGAKNARVFNNTVINGGMTEHAALFFNVTDVWVSDNFSAQTGSQNIRIQNNLFVQANFLTNAMVRVRENALIGNNNLLDNNLYYDPNSAVFLDDNLDWQEWSLSQWTAQTARDAHSLTADPLLDETFHLLAGSPCIGAGANLPEVVRDADGHPRSDGGTDIGADEFGSVSGAFTAPPASNLSVQILGNPVSDELRLNIHANQTIETDLLILGAGGQMYYHERLRLPAGMSAITLPVSTFPAGVFFIQIAEQMLTWVKTNG